MFLKMAKIIQNYDFCNHGKARKTLRGFQSRGAPPLFFLRSVVLK